MIDIELSFSHEKVRRKFLFIFRQPVLSWQKLYTSSHNPPSLSADRKAERVRTMRACFTAEGVHLSVGGSIRPKDKLT